MVLFSPDMAAILGSVERVYIPDQYAVDDG